MIDRQAFYNRRAASRLRETNRYYQRFIRHYFSFLVPAGARALELGCGLGDLLASLKPSYGKGIDFSPNIIKLAQDRHPKMKFQVADASGFSGEEKFDYILLSDL